MALDVGKDFIFLHYLVEHDIPLVILVGYFIRTYILQNNILY